MIKKLLAVLMFISGVAQAQIFRLTYNTTVCPSPLNATTGADLYTVAKITSPGAAPGYFMGSINPTAYPLYQTQTGVWEICFNPFQTFRDGAGSLIPAGSTIYSIDVNFMDAAGSIFTGNCQHNYIRITTPMSSSSSNFPAIASGLVVATCNVGLQEISNAQAVISQSANPLTSNTTFRLLLKDPAKVNLDIYNVLGKKVCSIVDGKKLSGYTEFNWDGTAENGSLLANGCYYYSLKLNDKIYTSNKLIIAR